MPILDPATDLNPAQRRAVEHSSGPVLVIAGAGSGKTRVLTSRVAHLLARGTAPEAVIAFTFTNRAAREMRERIERTVGPAAAARLWVGTFHATGARILRREAGRGTLPWARDFSIYDREDQESLLRELWPRLGFPEGTLRPGEVLHRISGAKNALVDPAAAQGAAVSPHEKRIAEAYGLYQAELRRRGALDFDDLIGEVVRLLLDDGETGRRYRARFEHVLVDEYQDTNHAQFRMVAALGEGHGNVFVVGDDDQSIYGWRGADLSNVLEFEQAFPGATVVRLEQNYRSTANILRAANAVIANNRSRKGKTLWCEREEGARLRFVLAPDELAEAQRITRFLAERNRRGLALRDIAVLYRTHAQSRALESELRRQGVPYAIVGGVSFYQRREVKDVLAYLRLALNPADAVAFWRVWNTPRRGLGDVMRARLEQRLAGGARDLPEALRAALQEGAIGAGGRDGAQGFLALLEELQARQQEPAEQLVRLVLERSGYLRSLDELPADEAEERRANVEELVVAAGQFAALGGEAGLAGFLAESALVTDLDRLGEEVDHVRLLTAHNAKGLEFAVVVVAGLEEGLFPHGSSLDDTGEMEEERRLFYVALTRARDEVLLTAAAFRRRFDGAMGGQVSRFVEEIPDDILDRELPVSRPAPRPEWADGDGPRARGTGAGRSWGGARRRASEDVEVAPVYRTRGELARVVGREVFHESFGRGVVMAAEGEGGELRFTVRFGTQVKKVLGRFLSGGTDVD